MRGPWRLWLSVLAAILCLLPWGHRAAAEISVPQALELFASGVPLERIQAALDPDVDGWPRVTLLGDALEIGYRSYRIVARSGPEGPQIAVTGYDARGAPLAPLAAAQQPPAEGQGAPRAPEPRTPDATEYPPWWWYQPPPEPQPAQIIIVHTTTPTYVPTIYASSYGYAGGHWSRHVRRGRPGLGYPRPEQPIHRPDRHPETAYHPTRPGTVSFIGHVPATDMFGRANYRLGPAWPEVAYRYGP